MESDRWVKTQFSDEFSNTTQVVKVSMGEPNCIDPKAFLFCICSNQMSFICWIKSI